MRHRELDYAQIKKLYTEGGLTTYAIARELGLLQNSVLCALRRLEIVEKHIGRRVEDAVARWLERRGDTVVQQRGDAPYDLLVGGERVDVKSANPRSDEGWINYSFQLQCKKTRLHLKNLHESVDWFYLVFLGKPRVPIYALRSKDVAPYQQTLTIGEKLKTKHRLIRVGNLTGGDKIEQEN